MPLPPDPLHALGWATPAGADAATVPESESLHFAAAAAQAHQFATLGRIVTGYLILYAGMVVARDSPEAWGPECARMREVALRTYQQTYPRDWEKLVCLDP